jgi:nitrate/nitrite transporter NarK
MAAALMSALLVVRLTASYDTALLVPPVAVLFASLWKLTSDDEPAPRAVIRGALALLALSFLVHAVGPKTLTALGYSGNAWPYQLKGILKHTTEMAGWMLLASGLFAGVSDPKEGRLGNAS